MAFCRKSGTLPYFSESWVSKSHVKSPFKFPFLFKSRNFKQILKWDIENPTIWKIEPYKIWGLEVFINSPRVFKGDIPMLIHKKGRGMQKKIAPQHMVYWPQIAISFGKNWPIGFLVSFAGVIPLMKNQSLPRFKELGLN